MHSAMRQCIFRKTCNNSLKIAISMLDVVKYPHPVLRHESRPIRRVDKELREIVRTMFELMYNNSGVGLAGNQVGLPYRLVVMNMNPDARDSRDEIVLINPVILKKSGHEENEEGCLSLPGIYAPVERSANVTATAYDLQGVERKYKATGLLARAFQHECDHLDGVLFIDRTTARDEPELETQIIDLEREFNAARSDGAIPDDDAIAEEIARLEKLRT